MEDFTLQFLADQVAQVQNRLDYLINNIRNAPNLGYVQAALAEIDNLDLGGPQKQDYSGKWAVEFKISQQQLARFPNALDWDVMLRNDEGAVMLYDTKEAADSAGRTLLPRLQAGGFDGYAVVKFGGHE